MAGYLREAAAARLSLRVNLLKPSVNHPPSTPPSVHLLQLIQSIIVVVVATFHSWLFDSLTPLVYYSSALAGFSATNPFLTLPPAASHTPLPICLSVCLSVCLSDWIVVPGFQSLGSLGSPNIYNTLLSGSFSLVLFVNPSHTCLPYLPCACPFWLELPSRRRACPEPSSLSPGWSPTTNEGLSNHLKHCSQPWNCLVSRIHRRDIFLCVSASSAGTAGRPCGTDS
ncbi:hypothetical protein FJTKL_10257 [Diaporthe vaccinii]|uniref:Uncharacterized protein n=1 Tax=Diaporthe vaccinii TaxID=105482 RepID=A0ABR4EKA7_9PEZI